MRIFIILVVHAAAIILLLLLGLHLNTFFSDYAGLVTVFSLALGIYSTTASVLYNRSRRFHLFVNRLVMHLRRTHTYWNPQVSATLPPSRCTGQLLDQVWEFLSGNTHGTAKLVQRTSGLLAVDLDNLIGLRVRCDPEGTLAIYLDRKLLVPSHLYDKFRLRIAKLMEEITRISHVESLQCSLRIDFDEGQQNPYYGFFINRVPGTLLKDFQVDFEVSARSRCRVEARKECVNVEGCGLAELFDTAGQVLSLRALPSEA